MVFHDMEKRASVKVKIWLSPIRFWFERNTVAIYICMQGLASYIYNATSCHLTYGRTPLTSFRSAPNVCKNIRWVRKFCEFDFIFITYVENRWNITSAPYPFTYTLEKSSEGSGIGLSWKHERDFDEQGRIITIKDDDYIVFITFPSLMHKYCTILPWLEQWLHLLLFSFPSQYPDDPK